MPEKFVNMIPKDMNVCLLGLQGSRMLGLQVSEDADYDYRGVFIAPTRDLVGLTQVKETIEINSGCGDNDAEFVFHELGKFVRLCLKGNPSVIHLLFVPKFNVKTNVGDMLVQNRNLLLGEIPIRNAFGGYALSQIMRLKRNGHFPNARKRKKHIRHCFRLFDTGRELLETGSISFPLKNPELYHEIAEIEDDDKLVELFKERNEEFRTTKSILPPQPDLYLANELLIKMHITDAQKVMEVLKSKYEMG
jgi:hypothetical protein